MQFAYSSVVFLLISLATLTIGQNEHRRTANHRDRQPRQDPRYRYETSQYNQQEATRCNVPPTLWCDSDSIMRTCGTHSLCARYNQTVADRKIKVTLLYEALCPDCQHYIKFMLTPRVWRYLSSIIDLELVPYGNAKTRGSQITCQHGRDECLLNLHHSCVMATLGNVARWYPYIQCMEMASSLKYPPQQAISYCDSNQRLSQTDISRVSTCRTNGQGQRLQLEAGRRTDSIRPEKHSFVPWILINDVSTRHLQDYMYSLDYLICRAYRGRGLPATCRDLLVKEPKPFKAELWWN